jgi:hypothetical protein
MHVVWSPGSMARLLDIIKANGKEREKRLIKEIENN